MSKENKKVKYKLIDEEGFIKACPDHNREIAQDYIKNGIAEGTFDNYGDLDVGYPRGGIDQDELEEFFTFVGESEDKQPHLWDGEEELEVGMVVKYKGSSYTIKYLEESDVVFNMGFSGLQVVDKSYLQRASKTHKEETLEKVMDTWCKKGVDFAFDTQDSKASLGEVFDVVYEIMRGE